MELSLIANIIALLFSFFVVGAILGAVFSKPIRNKIISVLRFKKIFPEVRQLEKYHMNPIMTPGHHPWTAEAVLNPAAAIIRDRTHLIYRAIGMDGVSRLGHASSPNGILFDRKTPYPIYVARGLHARSSHIRHRQYAPAMYPSGGSWGGYEDPRMVVIDGRVYVTFNMFENWTLRVAVISISEEDFVHEQFWKWTPPIILSHGTRDKNWVLFPEKINGQFAVLHSIIDDDPHRVRIEYTDDLATLHERTFTSPDPQQMPDNQIAWHYRMRSAGPPPLRTERGWLVFYHAMDPKEPNRYKLGAMLLDLDDPTKVLYRANAPILSPDARYENDGKPGIVYACGAVVHNGILYIYYGGGDRVICVATTPLGKFVDALIKGTQPEFVEVDPADEL